MAQDVLMLAVRDHLRANLGFAGLPPEMIEVMADGRPDPRAGKWFLSIHEGYWRFDRETCQQGQGLAELIGVSATVSLKVGEAPFSRLGVEAVAKASKGLFAVCRQVLLAIDDNELIRIAANEAIGIEVANGFTTPLWWEDTGPTAPQGPSWWMARGTGKGQPAGLSRTLNFGGALRLQRREEAT